MIFQNGLKVKKLPAAYACINTTKETARGLFCRIKHRLLYYEITFAACYDIACGVTQLKYQTACSCRGVSERYFYLVSAVFQLGYTR